MAQAQVLGNTAGGAAAMLVPMEVFLRSPYPHFPAAHQEAGKKYDYIAKLYILYYTIKNRTGAWEQGCEKVVMCAPGMHGGREGRKGTRLWRDGI